MNKIPEKIDHVLVVDDEAVVRNGISRALGNREISAVLAVNGHEALDLLAHQGFDLILLDIRMPDIDGIDLLKEIRARRIQTPVIMITGYPTIDTAVDCIRLGAQDYLVKPFRLDDLDAALTKLGQKEAQPEISAETGDTDDKISDLRKIIIGESRPMRNIFDKILKVAPTDSTVLITGESGTGKELVAKAIHAYSNRGDKEFVAVDCSSLVETLLESELFGHVKGSFTGALQTKHGLFELANHGTFFFDESPT